MDPCYIRVNPQPYGTVSFPVNALPTREIARDARRKAILDIGREAFLADGFSGASMSSIAARMGGSKGTLYNYFRSKEELFEAIMQEACGGEAVVLAAIAEGGELSEVLRNMGRRMVRFVTLPESVGMYRLVAAECQRFPEIGRLFWENGPALTLKALGDYLSRQMEAGALRAGDAEQAGSFLMGMFKAGVHQAALWNIHGPLTDAEVDAQAEAAVQAFLHGYGPASAGETPVSPRNA